MSNDHSSPKSWTKDEPADARLVPFLIATMERLSAAGTWDNSDVSIHKEFSEDKIAQGLGFSPFINPKTGARFGDPHFEPFWSSFNDHGGWYELTVPFGEKFNFVLFIAASETADPKLLGLAREFASPTSDVDRRAGELSN